jgi:hypothetical protein
MLSGVDDQIRGSGHITAMSRVAWGLPPQAVIAAAKEAGFGRSTIYAAREEPRDEIVNTGGRRSTGNCWCLAVSLSKESKEFSVF